MNLECVDKYLDKLESSIEKYMEEPASQRSAEAVASMLSCWEHVKNMRDELLDNNSFTPEDDRNWCNNMTNSDGTYGEHWDMRDTEAYRIMEVPDYVWHATMNMMYSDYYNVAIAYGVNRPEFYSEMAKAFLDDEDAPAPEEKLALYYHGIAKK